MFLETCRRACIGARVEAGSGLGHDQRRTRPADVLVPDWMLGKPAAFDITITSPLNPSTSTEASVTAGSAALAAEQRKRNANDEKCSELGWKSVPLAVESYGCWDTAAPGTIGFSSCYTLQHLEVPGYLQSVRETQLDPGEGKCLSSAVPPNVLSRHLLDSVLHNNPVGAFIPNRVIIRSWEYQLVTLSFVGLSWIGNGLRQVFYLRGWKMLVKLTPKWLLYSSGFVVVTVSLSILLMPYPLLSLSLFCSYLIKMFKNVSLLAQVCILPLLRGSRPS